MINNKIHIRFHEAGIQIDMLGQKLKVGDTVLTKNYGSPALDKIATIKKVNKKTIVVDLEVRRTDWGTYTHIPKGHKGLWNYYPDRKTTITIKPMKRTGFDCIKITPEQLAIAKEASESLINDHPEIFI